LKIFKKTGPTIRTIIRVIIARMWWSSKRSIIVSFSKIIRIGPRRKGNMKAQPNSFRCNLGTSTKGRRDSCRQCPRVSELNSEEWGSFKTIRKGRLANSRSTKHTSKLPAAKMYPCSRENEII
jgi:hypothetical protein